MSPAADDLYNSVFGIDRIHQPVLMVYPPRVQSAQIADELFISRIARKRIIAEKFDQRKDLTMKSGGKRLLHILYCIFGIDYLPTSHSGSSVAHSSFGVAKPFKSLSRIPGMLTKYNVSWIERQSSSATITTFPFFPVTQTGSLLSIASSMSRKKFFRAVVAFVIDIANTTCTLLCT